MGYTLLEYAFALAVALLVAANAASIIGNAAGRGEAVRKVQLKMMKLTSLLLLG